MTHTTCAMFSLVKFPNLLHISIFVGMHKLDRAIFWYEQLDDLIFWNIDRFVGSKGQGQASCVL